MRTQRRRSKRDRAELSLRTPNSSFWQDWCTWQAARKACGQHRGDKNTSNRDLDTFHRERTTETTRWPRGRLERGETARTSAQERPPPWRDRATFSHWGHTPPAPRPPLLCRGEATSPWQARKQTMGTKVSAPQREAKKCRKQITNKYSTGACIQYHVTIYN